MAREAWAYRDVAVESVFDAHSGRLRIRPMPGQAYATSLRVQCSRALCDPERYPAGTRFLVSAKLTDRQGGEPFLYAWHGDPVRVLGKRQAAVFLEQYRRLRL
ncbi:MULTISPECIES: hypothetical protein [unclassified Massilia]|uniref:hypothetical protein n=1 Tax=unclassified Massilia TaxID=2609279 RepID=UPI001B824EAF|nr:MULTISPECIES: hypothetical protein [unclassified Massilia]MBQ5939050.1 hypothetical protein [Massilia sp. AB1]MBQ5962399.1 hypothetical protein [Massilia sp. ZL223]